MAWLCAILCCLCNGPTSAPDSGPCAAEAGPASVTRPALTLEQWHVLQSKFPELMGYQPSPDQNDLLHQLVSWVEVGQTTTLYDATCRPIINAGEHEGKLQGDVLGSRHVADGHKSEYWYSVVLGVDVTVLCGTTYEYVRDKNKKWREMSVTASGCLEMGPKNLYRVTEKAAWYGAPFYVFTKALKHEHERNERCRDGGLRTCSWKSYHLAPRIVTPDFGMSTGVSITKAVWTETNADCNALCPVSNEAEVDAAVNLMAGQQFIRTSDVQAHPPTVYRTLHACRENQRR
ncbi:MAG: hypothetical protein JXR83_19995 [Deltaproteobacteria bacterium]|nr:hypothetical protein [Deltaproteobacteria bacterium]